MMIFFVVVFFQSLRSSFLVIVMRSVNPNHRF